MDTPAQEPALKPEELLHNALFRAVEDATGGSALDGIDTREFLDTLKVYGFQVTSVPPAAAPVGELREWPKLTSEMIEAACEAHYGKAARELGGAEGVSLTVRDTDWTFAQAMRRMWPAMKRASLAAAPVTGDRANKGEI